MDFVDAAKDLEKAGEWGWNTGKKLDNAFHLSDHLGGVTPEALERTNYELTGVIDQRVRGEEGRAEAEARKKYFDGQKAMEIHQNHFLPEARNVEIQATMASDPIKAAEMAMHWTE